jgi:hypothetical protein
MYSNDSPRNCAQWFVQISVTYQKVCPNLIRRISNPICPEFAELFLTHEKDGSLCVAMIELFHGKNCG